MIIQCFIDRKRYGIEESDVEDVSESEGGESDEAYEPSTDEGEYDHISEISEAENSDEEEEIVQNVGLQHFLSKNRNENWSKTPIANIGRYQFQNILREREGITNFATQRVQNIEDTIFLFFRHNIIQRIVDMSNKEGRRIYLQWKEIDIHEFRKFIGQFFCTGSKKIFLGILYLIGVFKGKNEPVANLWRKDIGRIIITKSMARNRFQQILRVLRFDDAEARRRIGQRDDKLLPIREGFCSFMISNKN